MTVQVTDRIIWVTRDLAIPLECISSVEYLKKGWVIPRHALEIVYRNPISRRPEVIYLCDPSVLGFYRQPRLFKLQEAIAEAVKVQASLPPLPPEKTPVPEEELACEVCAAQPAFYRSYRFLAGGILFWYLSAESRHVHCRKHILIKGLPPYFTTAIFGPLGLSILFYPFILWQNALALKPALGKFAFILAVVPMLLIAGLLYWWFQSRP